VEITGAAEVAGKTFETAPFELTHYRIPLPRWWIIEPPGALAVAGLALAALMAGACSGASGEGGIDVDATVEARSELAEPTTEPSPTPTLQDRMTTLIRRAVGSQATGITVIGEPTTQVVRIDFDVADNISDGLRIQDMEKDVRDIFEAIYTSGLMVSEAEVSGYFPLVDGSGNTSRTLVINATLDADVAAKIDWNKDAFDVKELWTETFRHPDLR